MARLYTYRKAMGGSPRPGRYGKDWQDLVELAWAWQDPIGWAIGLAYGKNRKDLARLDMEGSCDLLYILSPLLVICLTLLPPPFLTLGYPSVVWPYQVLPSVARSFQALSRLVRPSHATHAMSSLVKCCQVLSRRAKSWNVLRNLANH